MLHPDPLPQFLPMVVFSAKPAVGAQRAPGAAIQCVSHPVTSGLVGWERQRWDVLVQAGLDAPPAPEKRLAAIMQLPAENISQQPGKHTAELFQLASKATKSWLNLVCLAPPSTWTNFGVGMATASRNK